MKPTLRSFISLILIAFCASIQAIVPQNKMLRDDIRTLRTEIAGTLAPMPVLQLRGGERVEVSFDQMSHEGRRFFYRVQHCDFNWRPTEGLFPNEYIEANQKIFG